MAVVFEDYSMEIIGKIEGDIEMALEEIAREFEHKVRFKYVPVVTGRLKNSIKHETEKTQTTIIADTEYAAAVEFGHRQEVGRYVPKIGKRLVKDYVAGKHYMKQAGENHREEYLSILAKHLRGY